MQVVLFTNDKTVSKGMVKYASNLSRESIIDVGGSIVVPEQPVAACTQSQVLLRTSHVSVRVLVLTASIGPALPANMIHLCSSCGCGSLMCLAECSLHGTTSCIHMLLPLLLKTCLQL